jgi:hypothetical protein
LFSAFNFSISLLLAPPPPASNFIASIIFRKLMRSSARSFWMIPLASLCALESSRSSRRLCSSARGSVDVVS